MSGADAQHSARRLLSRAAVCLLISLAAGGATGATALAAAPSAAPAHQRQGVQALLGVLADTYRQADPTHETTGAARARTMAGALSAQIADWRASGAPGDLGVPERLAGELVGALGATRERLQPWAPPLTIDRLVARLRGALARSGLSAGVRAKPYSAIEVLLDESHEAEAAGATQRARGATPAIEAYALYAAGPGARLSARDPAVDESVEQAFWQTGRSDPGVIDAAAGGGVAGAASLRRASERAQSSVDTAATVLGDRTIGKDTVVADAAVIVFREGLEAVLILAAITASFVGERRRLRRPVLLGALAGLGATAVTYVLAQALVDALGDGGLRLQAITGVLAIAVLLLVTNWFFHRVYWSEWLGRFHKRRRALEKLDRFGFLSGQLVGLALLGLTSVYREGFETVLFLQNLQVSAGSQATTLGILIGLAGTLAVGFVTFKLERKLPYKKMLIATGVLIGLVLGVMVGTTVHSLQGLGWLPTTPTGFSLAPWWGQWLGVYATWEGIAAQLAALLVVYGSYALARQLQTRRHRRVPREAVTLARG
jgi:high-affinity iron transporter